MGFLRRTSRAALLIVASLTISLLFALAVMATADPFFNSSEPGCDGSDPNVLMCEDFETADALHLPPAGPGPGVGTWASENADVANSNGGIDVRTKGWAMWIREGYPHSMCGPGIGFAGSNCAARSILQAGTDGGGQTAMAEHNFAPSTGPGQGTEYTEFWARFYYKRSAGFVFNDSQKFISLNPCCAGRGGIFFGGLGDGGNGPGRMACPVWDCNYEGYQNPQNPVSDAYLHQNQGRDINVRNLNGHWIFLEFHVKLNTYNVRNGILEMWIDDCGTSGTLCTGTPTLRARYTNVGWSGISSFGPTPRHDAGFGELFLDIWGNPSDGGTILFDNIKVAKAGPIGFLRQGTVTASPPATPTNLTVR